METLKAQEQEITEEFLTSIIGKLIHSPNNIHRMNFTDSERNSVNFWFAGTVIGFDKSVLFYDFMTNSITDKSSIRYSILLSDGVAYVLAPDCEIQTISEEDFIKLVEKTQEERAKAMGILNNDIIEGEVIINE